MSVVQTTEQYPISQLDYVRIQVPCPYFHNLVMNENTQDLNHQLYWLHGIGHCKNIKGCYMGHVSFGVSHWKSSFPYCLCCCFLMVLVYLMQMVLSLKKPEDQSELRCSFPGFLIISYLIQTLPASLPLFLLYWGLRALSPPLFPQWILSSYFIHDLINVFPKEPLKFLKKSQLSHSINRKIILPRAFSCTLLFLETGTRSFHFQVPATASS